MTLCLEPSDGGAGRVIRMSWGRSLNPLTGHAPLASAPNAPFSAHHRKRRRGIFIEVRGLFHPNRDKLGPLPLPNGDSIEPRDSSSELAAYGDPPTSVDAEY